MTRFLISTAAILMLAAPVAANAARTTHKPVVHHAATRSHAAAAKPTKPRDAGQAATDQLNDQSLAKAKSGQ